MGIDCGSVGLDLASVVTEEVQDNEAIVESFVGDKPGVC